jgi:hypothetical protein
MDPSTRDRRVVIGWREWLALPELGIERVKAKVDTGARSSALHAFDVEFARRRGVDVVRFKVHPLQRNSARTVFAEAQLIDRRAVTNSGGRSEIRPVVRTTVRFMGRDWPIELTLTRRDVMGFRMLLGRQALGDWFVVDPSRSFLAGRPMRARPVAARKTGVKAREGSSR